MPADRNPKKPDPPERPLTGPRTLRTPRAVVSHIAHADDAAVRAERAERRGEAWWDALDADFYKSAERFDNLGLMDRMLVSATAGIDVLIRTGAALGLSLLAAPPGFNPLELKRSLADRPFYESYLTTGDPQRYFLEPQGTVPVRVRRVTEAGVFQPRDGSCENLRFESPFVPRNPRLRKGYLSHERNRMAHVRYWRHANGPRPTVIAIHGFGAEGYALNQWMFALPWMYETLGLDVALFNLPFHGKRQTQFSPFSGHGFFAGGIARINEAFAQAVYDFRLLLNYLEEHRGVTEVGVTGISLGGFTSALLAATEPRLRFSIPNVPVASLADIVLEWEPLGTIIRAALKTLKIDVREARRLLAVSCPLTWKPILPKKRLMVIGGVGDRLAPPTHSRILWEHWDRPRLHWFPGSHVLHVDRFGYLHEIAKFFEEIGFGR
ncbi:MAG: alpha/beta hydrolase family protein [Deltaproteobacteria bacterium]|nr:alpha/beta hydrolase family protein [Deltaproteobacteria bacterium]